MIGNDVMLQHSCTPITDNAFRLLATAIASVRDYAIFVLDADGIVRTWNAGAQRIKGYSEAEIVGKHFSTFYTEDDIKRSHPQRELRVAAEVGRFEEEGWRVRKDGTTFWANVITTRVSDADGKVIGFAKVTRDLSEKRIVEEKLRDSEERFRLMVDGVRDYAIFLIDPNGVISTWNEGAERLKGYSSKQAIGQHFSLFYPEEDRETDKARYELDEAMLTGRYEEEAWRIRRDGTRFWANIVITALRDKTGEIIGFSNVTRDLTERRRSDERLRRANEELERRVERRTVELSQAKSELEAALQARDEFLSIASHELQTPLTSLKLRVQMLGSKLDLEQGKYPSPKELSKSIETIVRQSDRLSALIEYLLDISRVQLGKFTYDFETTDLSVLVRNAVDLWMEPLAAVGCPVRSQIEPGLIGEVDGPRFEQVISNLFSNAAKYAPGHAVEVSLGREGQEAIFKIHDHGPGIERARQDRIFDRYERIIGGASVSGLGLGLFIARSIVEGHHGRIFLESQPGFGSTFIIRLPLNLKRFEAEAKQ